MTSTGNDLFSINERQLIEKVRSMRRDRRKGLYLLFGIREDIK